MFWLILWQLPGESGKMHGVWKATSLEYHINNIGSYLVNLPTFKLSVEIFLAEIGFFFCKYGGFCREDPFEKLSEMAIKQDIFNIIAVILMGEHSYIRQDPADADLVPQV